MTAADNEAFPHLTADQLDRLSVYGEDHEVAVGEVLFRAGDPGYDLILVASGVAEVVRDATPELPEAVIARHDAGRFIGELNLLTGAAATLTARVVEPGTITRVSPPQFRRLMDQDPDLSDVILRALLARRDRMRSGAAARTIEILGSTISAAALALRTWAARERLPHTWVDIDSPEGAALATTIEASGEDLPAVVTPTGVLRAATPGDLAAELGLSYRSPGSDGSDGFDLVVVGGGPAGLAAAVYGASEGLKTVLLDAVAAGGQAAASSRIENYLGFTSGISGAELTGRAVVQAQKFGARINSPCRVAALHAVGGAWSLVLTDGTLISARAVVIATGARYRALPLSGWSAFEGAGIYYAATDLEARSVIPAPVAVVGGANSAGQAALYLAGRGSPVNLIVRGAALNAGMSSYLADRILADPKITVRVSSEITALHGSDHLEQITVTDRLAAVSADEPCRGLFCFIGAVPASDWLTDVDLDENGFVRTDNQLPDGALGPTWEQLGRRPLPFETSQPCVFATGDIRAGSMKRVAAAVGEGASAIRSVHAALGSIAV